MPGIIPGFPICKGAMRGNERNSAGISAKGMKVLYRGLQRYEGNSEGIKGAIVPP